mmetsp:Transcript_10501/g.12410  ORF Transcript_10501/g.12410 Transcript_10501/m.12410 type:complete len:84 (-) Transcript_10501:185-436(-)
MQIAVNSHSSTVSGSKLYVFTGATASKSHGDRSLLQCLEVTAAEPSWDLLVIQEMQPKESVVLCAIAEEEILLLGGKPEITVT